VDTAAAWTEFTKNGHRSIVVGRCKVKKPPLARTGLFMLRENLLYSNETIVYDSFGRSIMSKNRRKLHEITSREDNEAVVISFRAPLQLVNKLDELAENDHRNRANFVLTTLIRATSEELVRSGEFWLKAFHQLYAKDPVGRETEFYRGQIAGWKRTLVAAYGASMAEKIILRASTGANLPVPHAGPLSPDERGYLGFDSFSHM
jgi:hypothetical protein